METISALLAICAGNSPVTGEFSAQRPVTLSFVVFFDKRLSCEAGDLRCHRNHYVVTVMWLDPMLYSGYYVHLAPNFLRISVKWATKYDMYQGYVGWIVDQWSHVAITWAAGQEIRAYLTGCDLDADDSKGYAYTMRRTMGSSMWVPFNLMGSSGTTVDELYIWHDLLTSHQIW